jgi:hypothetical protein
MAGEVGRLKIEGREAGAQKTCKSWRDDRPEIDGFASLVQGQTTYLHVLLLLYRRQV